MCNGRNSLSCMAKVKWFVTGSLGEMVARVQWLFRFVKVMFGRNTWLVMNGMVKKV